MCVKGTSSSIVKSRARPCELRRRARQSEYLSSWRYGLGGVQAEWRCTLSWSDS